MFQIVKPEQAKWRTKAESSPTAGDWDYFGKSSDHQFGPEAFLVVCDVNATVGAHYHPVDQYQVFFGSSGSTYQRRPIPQVLLHYTDAYKTYGPFATAGESMSFFTLRPFASTDTGWMPGSRERMAWRGARQREVDLEELLSLNLPGHGRSRVHTLFHDAADELRASLVAIGPNSDLDLPNAGGGSGAYVVVLDGLVGVGEERLGPRSLVWVGPETSIGLRSEDGSRVLITSFPSPLTTERSARAPG